MQSLVGFKTPTLQKLVFELRYDYGYTYLDRAGKTVNTIMREHPAWTLFGDDPSPHSGSLINVETRCVFNFSSRKLDLSLERTAKQETLTDEEVRGFASHLNDLTAIVVDHLGLQHFSRIGCRAWLLFNFNSREESEEWLTSLGLYSVPPYLANGFSSKVDAVGISVVLIGQDRKYRIAFNGVERQVPLEVGEHSLVVPRKMSIGQDKALKKAMKSKALEERHAKYAAMIDIDVYQDAPEGLDAGGASDFVVTSVSGAIAALSKANIEAQNARRDGNTK